MTDTKLGKKITYRVGDADKENLERLAKIFRRSESDTLRHIVREALKAFDKEVEDEMQGRKTGSRK